MAMINKNEITKEQLEKALENVAGGVCWSNCPTEASCNQDVCGTVGWENFKGC